MAHDWHTYQVLVLLNARRHARLVNTKLAEGEGFEPPEAHHLGCFQDMEGNAVFELGPMVLFLNGSKTVGYRTAPDVRVARGQKLAKTGEALRPVDNFGPHAEIRHRISCARVLTSEARDIVLARMVAKQSV